MSDMARKEAIEVLKDIVSKPMLYSIFIMGACKVALASLEADEAYQLEYENINCMDCEHSHITIQYGYCQCKLTGNCYIPSIMADKISEDCPLYKEESKVNNG